MNNINEDMMNLLKDFSKEAPGFAFCAQYDNQDAIKGAVGVMDINSTEPITTKTIFNLASISKQFTAFSILLLEEENKLSLEDSIRKYVPQLSEYADIVTIRHLLHHTGGLFDYMDLAEEVGISFRDKLTVDQALSLLEKKTSAKFEVGTAFEYSNTGYFLLSQVIEKASGMTQSEFSVLVQKIQDNYN
ncbi:Beta-lactamase [Peribacillus simplex]|uniref:Beta-lactamase n=1 Tax=Peribacillus simplex TaxID=1478 RepID=A0A9X8WNP1_9BACI|nr:serine hydrolase domain-containing protein [Peribacillus simplex]SIS15262.1 Beta-lactamase [Peribacillus simplex]